MAYKRLYSNEDTIETLAEVAKQDGWDIMVKDAFMIVEKFADYENMEDRINQTRLLISEVGYKITNKIRR
jgi:hypothetical protein